MAVVSTTEIKDSRRGEQVIDKAERVYTRTFHVYTNSNADGPATVLASGSLPAMGAVYLTAAETDLGAVVKSREATQAADDPLLWIVTITYGSIVADPDQFIENPVNRPAKWKFSFQKEARAVFYDLDGQPLVNSAGQPYMNAPEISITRPILQAEKNVSSFSFAYVANVVDCINAGTWNGFAPGTVKIDSVEISQEYENNVAYHKFNWQFSVNWEGWDSTPILDAGMYEIVDIAGSSSYFSSYVPGEIDSSGWVVTGSQQGLRLIRDAFGTPVTSPQLLCGGRALPPEARDFPCFRYYRFYRWLDFTGIPE